MTEATANTKTSPVVADDPETYRMSIGDHLEELRWRLILALIGFAVVALVFLLFVGTEVVTVFCAPLYKCLQKHHMNPQLYYSEIGSAFVVYIHISLISAAAIAGPWMVYQFWKFVASGLYKHERELVTRYLPLSIALLISGMLFVYFLVLPWTLDFFIGASDWFPMPQGKSAVVAVAPDQLLKIPTLEGDPKVPGDSALWFNIPEGKLKLHVKGQTSVMQFLPETLIAPHITLDTYIDMVVMMLLVFALAFQLPLIVMAIIRIGLVEVDTLKRARKIVYFVLLIAAAAITPGDVITATVALMLPLILLYELGMYLGARGLRLAEAAAAAEEAAERAAEEQEKSRD